jgi:thiol-disulfide isomerase/thioredoxin
MDRRLLPVVIGIAVAIVAAIVAVVVFGAPTAPDAAPATETATTESTPTPEATTPGATPGVLEGAYVEYSNEAIAQAEGRVLLFFHAPWCPQCRSVESDIIAEGVPAGVTIIKVDYDSRQDLRQRYGVTLQTTFVEVDADGTELQKHVAYDDPHLAAVVAAML